MLFCYDFSLLNNYILRGGIWVLSFEFTTEFYILSMYMSALVI